MKRVILMILAALLLCGCSPAAPQADAGKVRVVCTVFPLYDWVNSVAAGTDAVDVVLLTDNGVDLHNYQPSARDIVTVAESDLFLYVGGASDAWAADVLRENPNAARTALSLYGMLEGALLKEETVEGMQQEHDEEEGDGTDEHLWLSLNNARTSVDAVADALCALDPAHADAYKKNATAYSVQLFDLDTRSRNMVSAAKRDVLLFCDRFPFRYLTEEYGLTYYAAFAGCSAETEADFDTVAFLTEKLRELQLPAVLIIEGSDAAIAETVVAGAGSDAEILTLDSLQQVTAAEIADNISYLSVMEDNLRVLDRALN